MQHINRFLFLLSILFFFVPGVFAQIHNYVNLPMSGSQEVPPRATDGTGTFNGTYNESTNEFIFTVTFSGLSDSTTAAHFHGPASIDTTAGVQIGWTGFPVNVMSGSFSDTVTLNDTQEADLLAGLWYANIHTQAYTSGEIRGQLYEANGIHYYTDLEMSGNNEVPPVVTTGSGVFRGRYYESTMQLIFTVTFENLSDTTTAAHFHGPAPADSGAGVQIGWTGFPTGVTSGTFTDTVTLNATQQAQLLSGRWYANIHSADFTSGEIRAQLIETPVPVELTSFSASVTGKSVHLKWNTASEVNNSGFEVQRSVNKQSWNTLGFVQGRGTTLIPADYNYSDNTILSGRYYYRLKQIDFNGSFEFSEVVEVFAGLPEKFVLEQNYPNPFNPSTTIKFAFDANTRAELKVYDVLGNEVKSLFNENAEGGRVYEVNFDASSLASGVYYYKLTGNNKSEIKKMMLLK